MARQTKVRTAAQKAAIKKWQAAGAAKRKKTAHMAKLKTLKPKQRLLAELRSGIKLTPKERIMSGLPPRRPKR